MSKDQEQDIKTESPDVLRPKLFESRETTSLVRWEYPKPKLGEFCGVRLKTGIYRIYYCEARI